MRKSTKGLLGIALFSFASVAAADFERDFSKVETALVNKDLDRALNELDNLHLSGSDEVLDLLNRALILRLQGKFAESTQCLEKAKEGIEKFKAISVTEQVASVTVNDTFKAYDGLPNEQLMIYAFEALNYLAKGNVEDAAVEARQFNQKQQLIKSQNKNASYLSGAFVRYLNGMIFEMAGEKDEARIEYENAIQGYQSQGMVVPDSLKKALDRIQNRNQPRTEIVFILQNGFGPSLSEEITDIPNPAAVLNNNVPKIFRIALPKYQDSPVPVDHVEMIVNNGESSHLVRSEIVEDVNKIGRMSFQDRIPTIQGRAVARMAAKGVGTTVINSQIDKHSDQLFGQFGQFGDLAKQLTKTAVEATINSTEKADTRAWALLPGNILMARSEVDPSQKNLSIQVNYFDKNGAIIGHKEFRDVSIAKGKQTYLTDLYVDSSAIRHPAVYSDIQVAASNSKQSIVSAKKKENFVFIGANLDVALDDPWYQNMGSQYSYTPNVLDYSFYIGGYYRYVGFEFGEKTITGGTYDLSNSYGNYKITNTGSTSYQSFLLRTNETEDFVFFKFGTASSAVTSKTQVDTYYSSYTNSTQYNASGSYLGIGFQSGPMRLEYVTYDISSPTKSMQANSLNLGLVLNF